MRQSAWRYRTLGHGNRRKHWETDYTTKAVFGVSRELGFDTGHLRAAIQRWQDSTAALSHESGINPKTVGK